MCQYRFTNCNKFTVVVGEALIPEDVGHFVPSNFLKTQICSEKKNYLFFFLSRNKQVEMDDRDSS